jgi:hypothetical protein
MEPSSLPLIEGSLLCFNRGSVLLMDRAFLEQSQYHDSFVRKKVLYDSNKAVLAVGDALLLLAQRYHYSYLVKEGRLLKESIPHVGDDLKDLYSKAVQFRINPRLEAYSDCDLLTIWENIVEISGRYHLLFEQTYRKRQGLCWERYPEAVFRLSLHRPSTWLRIVRTNLDMFGFQPHMLSLAYLLVPLRLRCVAAMPLLLYTDHLGFQATRKAMRLMGILGQGEPTSQDIRMKYSDLYAKYLS